MHRQASAKLYSLIRQCLRCSYKNVDVDEESDQNGVCLLNPYLCKITTHYDV